MSGGQETNAYQIVSRIEFSNVCDEQSSRFRVAQVGRTDSFVLVSNLALDSSIQLAVGGSALDPQPINGQRLELQNFTGDERAL